MERFNYPNIEAVENEDGRILAMLEAESFGKHMDDKEEQEEREREIELEKMRAENEQ